MMLRANLYYLQDLPDLALLAATVGTPASGAPSPREGTPGHPMALLVGDVLVELERFGAADLRSHLDALHACVAHEYELLDSEFPARLKEARAAVAVTIDRGGQRAGTEPLLEAMAAGTNAFVLDEEGVFRDAGGRVLAAPAFEPGNGEDHGADEPYAAEVPSRDRVAQRALAAAALAWRAFIEREAPVGAAADVAAANAWLEKHGLFAAMTGEEQAVARAPFGSWTEKQVINYGWCTEAAVVLAWALRLVAELPAHDVQASQAEVQRALGLLAPAPAALAAELRPAPEIDDAAARLFAIVSRFRELTTAKGALDFAAFARRACAGSVDLQGISLAEGDLAVAGAPVSSAAEQDVLTAQSIAVERFRAIDWLQGGELVSALPAGSPER